MSVSNLEYTVDVNVMELEGYSKIHTVVWEYVVNGIQYREKNKSSDICNIRK